MPSASSAREFNIIRWPQHPLSMTGLLGAAASSAFRQLRGSLNTGYPVIPEIQPGPAAAAFATPANVSSAVGPGNGSLGNVTWRPGGGVSKCAWASISPGVTKRAPTSMMRVAGFASRRISAFVPMAVNRPPAIASASAYGCAASAVKTLALTSTRSGVDWPMGADLKVGPVASRPHAAESSVSTTISLRIARLL
jgi:hypothetical protein